MPEIKGKENIKPFVLGIGNCYLRETNSYMSWGTDTFSPFSEIDFFDIEAGLPEDIKYQIVLASGCEVVVNSSPPGGWKANKRVYPADFDLEVLYQRPRGSVDSIAKRTNLEFKLCDSSSGEGGKVHHLAVLPYSDDVIKSADFKRFRSWTEFRLKFIIKARMLQRVMPSPAYAFRDNSIHGVFRG